MSTITRQSHLRYPLSDLLASSGCVRVLRALLIYGGALSAAQLAKDSGLTPQGIRKVLETLMTQGIVTALGQPRSQVFTVAERHPFTGPLKALFSFERSQWEELQHKLRALLNKNKAVRAAWLYGSVARGEDGPKSDIDITVVMDSESTAADLQASLMGLEDQFNVNFSLIALTPEDVAGQAQDSTWWASVIRDARILKGASPQKEFSRCAQKVHSA